MSAHHASTDLVITRVFDAPVERVWDVWTQPQHIKKWWGPKDFTAPHIMSDFRIGGTFRYCMRGPAGSVFDRDMWNKGEFREIIPMKKIVAVQWFSDDDGNTITPAEMGLPGEWTGEQKLTVTFEDAGSGKTKLTLVHQGHPAEMVENATAGWNQSLDKFAAALS